MSAIWPLTGAKRTWQEKLVSVAIDPKQNVYVGCYRADGDRQRTITMVQLEGTILGKYRLAFF